MPAHDFNVDCACALARTAVSRETAVRLDRFAALLWKWQEITHLIASSMVQNLWTRPIADWLQLLDLAPAKIWVDVGTGDVAKCGARPDFVDVCLLAPG